MAAFTAVYDACVLYPAPLRDLLVRLAMTDLYRACWTDQIHDEWMRNLLANRPDITPERVRRTRDLMDLHVPNSIVTGHEQLIDGLLLPDPDDRHVLAAAIQARASVIVTFNLKDFPDHYLATFGVQAQHPDELVLRVLALNVDLTCDAIRRQRDARRRRPDLEEFLATFTQQRLPKTVERLRTVAHLL